MPGKKSYRGIKFPEGRKNKYFILGRQKKWEGLSPSRSFLGKRKLFPISVIKTQILVF